MNTDQIKVNADRGGFHRAIVLAEALQDSALWDGNTEIFFPHPYETHRRWSSARYEGKTVDQVLVAGQDYLVGNSTALPHEPNLRLDATTITEMAEQLAAEGWQFLPDSHSLGGFWHHSQHHVDVNNNGGCFDSYDEATRKAYFSAIRKLLITGHL